MKMAMAMATIFKPVKTQPHPKGKRFLDFVPFRMLKWSILAMLIFSSGMFWSQIRMLQSQQPPNPHYQTDTCPTCHIPDHGGANKTCTSCHDPRDVGALQGKRDDYTEGTMCRIGAVQPPITLCTRCHGRSGYMRVVRRNGKALDVDITQTHPTGMTTTQATYPLMPLPLEKLDNRTLVCTTCHDPHLLDKRIKMLRLTVATEKGNDPVELCHNCHHNNGVL